MAFIIQNSTATDPTYGAAGVGLTALGAGGTPGYPNQAGAMGYAGINNNLVVEFDIHQDAWDPNSSHVAVQTCGTNTNTPVHQSGSYTIGFHPNVPNCLYSSGAINAVPPMGGICSGSSCSDGAVHQVVIEYTPPTGHQGNGNPGDLARSIIRPGDARADARCTTNGHSALQHSTYCIVAKQWDGMGRLHRLAARLRERRRTSWHGSSRPTPPLNDAGNQ